MKQLKPQYIGLITGVAMIMVSLVAFYQFKVPFEGKFKLVVYSLYSAGILWSLFVFHLKDVAGKKFKDYFSEGFKAFIIVVLMMVIYTFVFIKMNPQIFDAFIEENNKALMQQGNRTPAEIAKNAADIRAYTPLVMTMGALVIYLIIGVLITLVGAGFLSQKNTGEEGGR